jgi:small-conductance mechanosensitive channel
MSLLLNIAKYALIVFQVFITFPIVFRFFEPTKNLASTIFGYIVAPIRTSFIGVVHFIPDLIAIIVIIIIMRYVLRTLKFFTMQISKGKLVIPGFYADWADPTYNILRVLLYAFTFAIIYPHLPNSESNVFKGVSVFVGVLFSLGSSSFIGNLIAGIVMTYMRPFKIGDRIMVNGVTGFVVEKSLMVIRLRTDKNEYVSFPNQIILNTSITNYNTSADEENGLIVPVEITMGYATDWVTVHRILMEAAKKTEFVLENPPPFVLQKALDDFYCRYEINIYTRNAEKLPALKASLFQNIQNGFSENGISMYAPHYRVLETVDKI